MRSPSAGMALRPMAMGELVDRSASLWRAQFTKLFQLYVVLQLLQYAGTKAYALAMMRWTAAVKDLPPGSAEELLSSVLDLAAGWTGVAVLSLVLNWFGSVAAARLISSAAQEEPVGLEAALAHAFRRLPATLGTLGISILWWLGSVAVLSSPGGLLLWRGFSQESPVWALAGAGWAMLAVLGVSLFYLLRFFLSAQVISEEPTNAWAAFRRSGALVRGKLGSGAMNWVGLRATVLISAVGLVVLAVGFTASIPTLIVQLLYGNLLNPMKATPEAVPQLLLIPAELVQVAVQAAVSPLFAVFGTLFYLDIRARREGLDLELRLRALTPEGSRAP